MVVMFDDETEIVGGILGKVFLDRRGHAVCAPKQSAKEAGGPADSATAVRNGNRRTKGIPGIRKHEPTGVHRGKQHG